MVLSKREGINRVCCVYRIKKVPWSVVTCCSLLDVDHVRCFTRRSSSWKRIQMSRSLPKEASERKKIALTVGWTCDTLFGQESRFRYASASLREKQH